MPVRQKLGMILEYKVVQKLKLEKKVFFLIPLILTSKTDFESTILALFVKLSFIDRLFLKCTLSFFILGQNSCILGPIIFEIPQPY